MSEFEPEALAKSLLKSVPDPVYIVDLDGRIVWSNGRLAEVTGYDREELMGKDAFKLLPEGQREAALEAFTAIESFSPTHTMEFDIQRADGECLPHEFNGTVLEYDGETVVATIARNVTERHERNAEIRRQRDELETLNRIDETLYEVIQEVTDAATREEIEDTICEKLAASGLYRSVWVGRYEPDGTVDPCAGEGPPEEFLAEVVRVSELEWNRPATVAVETAETQVTRTFDAAAIPDTVSNCTDEWDIEAGIAIPIAHRGNVVGVLCVYSERPEAFGDRERAALERLGGVIGLVIDAIQTERILLSDTTTELTFRVEGPNAFLAAVSVEADGPCRHEWASPVADGSGRYRHYVTVSGLDPERVVAIGASKSTIERIKHVGDNGTDRVFEVVTNDSFIRRLLEVGATLRSMVAEDGENIVVAEVPSETDVRSVVAAANELYDVELVSKRKIERPVRTTNEFYDSIVDDLSEKQKEAIRHAYFGGYFSWPRDATAEEIAAVMDISSPTFHYHIRRAQRTLVDAYLQHLED